MYKSKKLKLLKMNYILNNIFLYCLNLKIILNEFKYYI